MICSRRLFFDPINSEEPRCGGGIGDAELRQLSDQSRFFAARRWPFRHRRELVMCVCVVARLGFQGCLDGFLV